jgi:O-antigen ligase
MSPLLATLAIAGIYLLINATWSLSPASAYSAAFSFIAVVLVVYLISGALWHLDDDVLRAMALALYAGMVIGGAILLFEVATAQGLRRLLMSFVPAARPNARDMIVGAGGAMLPAPYLLNRSMAALTLLLWPALLATRLLADTPRQHRLMLLGLLPAVAAILLSAHATSKLALIGGIALFGLSLVAFTPARNVAVASWVAAIFLVVPLAYSLYANKLYAAPWLFDSAQARVAIWGHTSQQVLKAPVLGSGIATARALHDPEASPRAPASPHVRFTTGLHSHNAYLQTWYETGAVGAALLLAIGILIVRLCEGMLTGVRPYLLALFATCALIEASSFSMWAPWLMSSLGLTAAFATLGCALAARGTQATETSTRLRVPGA